MAASDQGNLKNGNADDAVRQDTGKWTDRNRAKCFSIPYLLHSNHLVQPAKILDSFQVKDSSPLPAAIWTVAPALSVPTSLLTWPSLCLRLPLGQQDLSSWKCKPRLYQLTCTKLSEIFRQKTLTKHHDYRQIHFLLFQTVQDMIIAYMIVLLRECGRQLDLTGLTWLPKAPHTWGTAVVQYSPSLRAARSISIMNSSFYFCSACLQRHKRTSWWFWIASDMYVTHRTWKRWQIVASNAPLPLNINNTSLHLNVRGDGHLCHCITTPQGVCSHTKVTSDKHLNTKTRDVLQCRLLPKHQANIIHSSLKKKWS